MEAARMQATLTFVAMFVSLIGISCATTDTQVSAPERVAAPVVELPVPDNADRRIFVRANLSGSVRSCLLLVTTGSNLQEFSKRKLNPNALASVQTPGLEQFAGKVFKVSIAPLSIEEVAWDKWPAPEMPDSTSHAPPASLGNVENHLNHKCIVGNVAYATSGEWPLRAYGPHKGFVCIVSADGTRDRKWNLTGIESTYGPLKATGPEQREFFDARTGLRLGPAFEEPIKGGPVRSAFEYWSADAMVYVVVLGQQVRVYDLDKCIPRPDPARPAAPWVESPVPPRHMAPGQTKPHKPATSPQPQPSQGGQP